LIVWPGRTLAVVTILFGSLMLVSGVVRFIQALFGEGSDHRWLLVLSAVLSVVLGIVIVRNPAALVWLIVLLTGILWIVGGMVDLFRGVADTHMPDRGVRVVFGALSALFGVVILLWPAPTVLVLAFLAGAYSVFFGVLEIVAALQIRRSD
jgi:uncharacterized membrane protein HdeD (DUF308 family)